MLDYDDLINIKFALDYICTDYYQASKCLKTGKPRQCKVTNKAFRNRMKTRRIIKRMIESL